LLVTFLESLGTVLFERGVYFYTEKRLDFSPTTNLWLAVVFGAVYVAGAMGSHAVSARLGEKRVLGWAMAVQVAMVLGVIWRPTGWMVFVAAVVLGLCNGMKWPVVESYVGAGRAGHGQATAVGRFNMAWSGAIPLALVVTGPLVAWEFGETVSWLEPGLGIFVVAGLCSVVSLWLIRPMAARPVHLAVDHPDRPTGAMLASYRGLLWSSRWVMLCGYAMLFILAPLMPFIFGDLGYGAREASSLSGVLDGVRFVTFVLLDRWVGWHGRAWPLVGAAVLMPVGFYMVVLGGDVATVLGGEVLFGVMAGVSYYAALYYAMVVKNASVDAGGVHEGLIGGGFFVGPLLGLLAQRVGYGWGVGPLAAACVVGGLLPLWAVMRARRG
jgi:MFS family permease